VKKLAFAAVLALTIGAAHARVIELEPAKQTLTPTAMRMAPESLVVQPVVAYAPGTIRMSELPEPAVFAMMLLGLVLIGYRARKESSEKFS
jgi:hypothetical protein